MKSKLNLKFFFFLATIISLVLTIILLRITYARYVTSLTAKSYVELGRWLILVNNQDITNNSDVSSVLTPVFENSDYIAEGTLAPASSGYVIIDVNYEGVSVPFKYDISFDYEADSVLEDLRLISYTIDDGEAILVQDSDTIITDTIVPDNTTGSKTFKLNFAWFDGDGEVLNDVQDTAYSRNFDEIGLRFNMKFTQVTNNS